MREFKIYGGQHCPGDSQKQSGQRFVCMEDPRSEELADYLVRQEVLNNLRGVKECSGDERSVDTFSFAPTTPDDDRLLNELNSFEGDQEVEGFGDIRQAFNKGGGA